MKWIIGLLVAALPLSASAECRTYSIVTHEPQTITVLPGSIRYGADAYIPCTPDGVCQCGYYDFTISEVTDDYAIINGQKWQADCH